MFAQPVKPTRRVWSNIQYQVDGGIGHQAHIGMVVIDTDQTLSYEARAMLSVPGIALYESRISSSSGRRNEQLSADLLGGTFREIDGALRQINSKRPSDVVALGCTSAAMVIGQQELERRVRNVFPRARVTDPFTGIVSALRALGSARIGFVSPYPRDLAEKMIDGIELMGVQVPAVGEFHNETGFIRDDAPFISPASISAAVHQVISIADIDAVVIACTQMRAAAAIDELEKQTGKAIISSNQALCWHALRLAACRDAVPGWGRLFQTDL